MGLYPNLYILHVDLDMHCGLHPLLLPGWMARLSHAKPAPKLFYVEKQRQGQGNGNGTFVSSLIYSSTHKNSQLTRL